MMYFVLYTPNLKNVPPGIQILRLPEDEITHISARQIKQMILTEQQRGYRNLYDTTNSKEPAIWIHCTTDIDPNDTIQKYEIERVPLRMLTRWMRQKKAA